MKRLILVGGPMGVGKSAVCRALMERLSRCLYLDGDWCWNMRPFSVTEETRALVLDNICSVLARDLRCPELDHVIFGWVLHQQETIDTILSRLPLEGVEIIISPSWPRRRPCAPGWSGTWRTAAGPGTGWWSGAWPICLCMKS